MIARRSGRAIIFDGVAKEINSEGAEGEEIAI